MSEVKKEAKTKKEPVKKEKSTVEEKKETKVKVSRKKATIEKEEVKEKKPRVTRKKVVVEKEEIKEPVVKEEIKFLSEKESHNCNILCKIIRILSKVCRICLMICIPFIFIAMMIIPIVFKKVEIGANIIRFDDDISIIIRDDAVTMKLGDDIQTLNCSPNEVDRMISFLSTHTNGSIVFQIEVFLLLVGIVIILNIYIFTHLENLFDNFNKEKTPYTDENASHILLIAKLILTTKIVVIFMSLLSVAPSVSISISVLELLIIYAIYYIFKYAVNMQKKINI